MGSENNANAPDVGVDNNRTKENTTSVKLADKIHCIRTNNITDEYELKEEIGVGLHATF